MSIPTPGRLEERIRGLKSIYRYRIRVTGFLILMMIAVTTGYTFTYFFALDLPLAGWLNLIFIGLYIEAYCWLLKGKYRLGQIWLAVVYNVHIFVYSAFLLHKDAGFQYSLLLVPVYISLVFNPEDRLYSYIISVAAVLGFFACEIVDFGEPFLYMPEATVRYFYLATMFIIMVSFLVISNLTIADMEREKQGFETLASTDMLTNTLSRRGLFDIGVGQFEIAKRHGMPLSLIILDIDHFKRINDSYGHRAGDQVIKCVAEIVRRFMRQSDFVGRYGGEEFVVLLPGTGLRLAFTIAEKLRCKIQNTDLRCGTREELKCTISLGITSVSESVESFEALLDQADRGLYLAKNSGRNMSMTHISDI